MSGLRCGPAATELLAIGVPNLGVDESCANDSGSDIVVHLKRRGNWLDHIVTFGR